MVLYRRSQRLCLEVSRTPVKLNERLYGNSWADAAFVLMSGIFTFLCALWGHRLPLNYANEVTVSLVSVAEHYSMYKGGFSQMDWDSHMWTAPTHCLIFSPRFSVTSSPPQEHFCVLCVSFFLFFFFFYVFQLRHCRYTKSFFSSVLWRSSLSKYCPRGCVISEKNDNLTYTTQTVLNSVFLVKDLVVETVSWEGEFTNRYFCTVTSWKVFLWRVLLKKQEPTREY